MSAVRTADQAAVAAEAGPTLEILAGTRILSFTQFLLGPAAVQYLADLGADVIKIEPPGAGAWERRWAGGNAFVGGESVFYLLSHRNVRSLALDLKHPEATGIIRRLVAQADVIVLNFRPRVIEKLGLSYEAVREINPRIIYASASGYGQDSPYRDRPGQDLLIQSLSGLASLTGRAGDPPTPTGAPIVDQHGAALLAMGILAALFHRQRTDQGQEVSVTMMQAAFDLQQEPIAYYLNGGIVRRPHEPLGSGFHPAPYGIYETQDGYLALSMGTTAALGEALDEPALASFTGDAERLAKRDEIRRLIAPFLRRRTTAEWLEHLQRYGVWCAPVYTYEEVFADPAVQHLDPVMEFDHPVAGRVRALKHPIRYGAGTPAVRRSPPAVGQHSREILAELGYTPGEINDLRAAGALG